MGKCKYTMTLRRIVISLEETEIEVETDNVNDAIEPAFLTESEWSNVDSEPLIYGFKQNLAVHDYQEVALLSLRDKVKESK